MTVDLACGRCGFKDGETTVQWSLDCPEHNLSQGVLLSDGTWCPRRILPAGQVQMMAWGQLFMFPVVGMN